MTGWPVIYIFVFAAGAVSTLLFTPLFRMIARKTGFMDVPAANHKGHRKATPLLGGAAIFCGWLSCLAGGAAAVMMHWVPGFSGTVEGHLPGMLFSGSQLLFIAVGGLLAVLLGLWDDRWAMAAKWKFLGQFAVALIAVLGGKVRINLFITQPVISCAISVFWLMLLMNSINFFDNMDVLAVGTIAIAMGFFTCFAALNRQFFVAALAAMTCGCACGFWVYNTSPASIFMGDSGSHFLGYLAAVISARVTYFNHGGERSKLTLLIPLFILALPLFDTAMVVLIRTLNKKPFWIGDHNHISHRFVRMGLSRPRAVLLVHLLALCIGMGMLPVYWGTAQTAMVMVAQALLMLLIITVLQLALSEKPDARE
jgi:UDP-GlcNAc:undecaprenyl-phosphate GlcNAc-1-phosphate transferase